MTAALAHLLLISREAKILSGGAAREPALRCTYIEKRSCRVYRSWPEAAVLHCHCTHFVAFAIGGGTSPAHTSVGSPASIFGPVIQKLELNIRSCCA